MDVTMPQLGETVTEGTITRWLKQVGEHVEADEPLFEVSTDKVDSEVPAPIAGVLSEIRVPEGETADVGTVLAVLAEGAPGESGPGGSRGTGRSAGGRGGRPGPHRKPQLLRRRPRHRHPSRLRLRLRRSRRPRRPRRHR